MRFAPEFFSIIEVDTHRRDDHALDHMAKEHIHGAAWAERSEAGKLMLIVPDHPAIVAKARRVVDQWAI